jgi:hypothetical protein
MKLTEAETEVRKSKKDVQKLSETYDIHVADMAERISKLESALNKVTTRQKEGEDEAMRGSQLETERVEAREKSLVEQVSLLT